MAINELIIKKIRTNRYGTLTVEACIALTIFLMVFITILYFMRIVMAYGVVQHALNQTAKEFSTYSYYYSISGLKDINTTIQNSTSSGISNFNTNVGNLVTVYETLGELGDDVSTTASSVQSGDIESIISSLQSVSGDYSDFKEAFSAGKETIQSIVSDPMAAIKSVGAVLLNGGNEALKTFLCGEISRYIMANYIEDGGYDAADTRLKNLRIVDGLGGLDFSLSKFWSSDNADDVVLTVCYTIDPIFPIDIIDEINMVNTVKIRGWNGEYIFE